MNKKQKNLKSKLGSWTDQAYQSRNTAGTSDHRSTVANLTNVATSKPVAREMRAIYHVDRSLMDRIADTAQHHDMKTSKLVGHLLTWALDQVDAGKHQLPGKRG